MQYAAWFGVLSLAAAAGSCSGCQLMQRREGAAVAVAAVTAAGIDLWT
jgi:hypothetical protein